MQDTYGVQVYLEPGEAVALNAGYFVTHVMKLFILVCGIKNHVPANFIQFLYVFFLICRTIDMVFFSHLFHSQTGFIQAEGTYGRHNMELCKLKTPCYVVDEEKLIHNLEILHGFLFPSLPFPDGLHTGRLP